MYSVPDHIEKNKIFIVQRSEIEGRLDPKMVLYNQKVQHSRFPRSRVKDLLVYKPQYGASEVSKVRQTEQDPRYIRITDIDENGLISHTNLGATAQNVDDKYILREDDILIARSGATVGKTYIHRKTPYECFFAGYLIRFIVDPDKILPDYFFAYTQLEPYKDWVRAIQRPSGQPNINAEEYQSLEIPLPTKSQQGEIVEIINTAYAQKLKKEAEAQHLIDSIDTFVLNELGITLPEVQSELYSRIFISSYRELMGGRLDPEYTLYFDKDCKSTKYDSVPLGSIAYLSKGSALTSKEVIPGNFPVIAGGQTSPYSHAEANFSGNVITVSASGAYAGYVWYHENPIFASDCSVVKSKNEGAFKTKFIFEVLKALQPVIYRLQIGAAQPHVYPADLWNIYIPIISISHQKRICEFIERKRQQAKALQAEGKSILENAKKKVERMILGE